ncbi:MULTISPECIES: hypothetical protein [unclassified Streptomyces]|uniref:hypothetical protein n=1 Tax=unclassified Streptomyces TaxID=2593676 RepID=UPI00288871A1|nr:hypothetical protein [Streptomyces sp. DSM 41633]
MKPILLPRAGALLGPAMARAARAVLCAGGVAALPSGCGASAARVDGARAAGERFERALASGDHGAACRLLAPETRGQLEQDQKKTCGVVAAGCTPQGEQQPYRCVQKGD